MKIKVSELFYSLQGEGRFVGVPSIFLRTFGCNFECAGFGMPNNERSKEVDIIAKDINQYKNLNDLPLVKTGCDSYLSWHPAFKHLSPMYETSDLVDMMLKLLPENNWQQKNGNQSHLVITGGEPLLGWQRAYPELLMNERMNDLMHVTFETNGTQELSGAFFSGMEDWLSEDMFRTITFSVSAKLSSSGEKREDAIKPALMHSYQDLGTVYLKFVVENEEHIKEVDEVVEMYRDAGFYGNVYLMPVGGTVDTYDSNATNIANMALDRGYCYSPRLHVNLWKNGWAR